MGFSIPTKQLEAFYILASVKSFSNAAQHLHITQSALSQRILKLEQRLNRKLFTRNHNNLEITDAGVRLLEYYRYKKGLEEELLNNFNSPQGNEISGSTVISSFSSVLRSVIMPSLSKLIIEHPKIQIDLVVKELEELPRSIYRSESDFIISQSKVNRFGYDNLLLGYEENVLITPVGSTKRNHILLDHNINDHFTEEYLKLRKVRVPKLLERSFVEDIYGIIDGVSLGYGIGVVPLHMLSKDSNVNINTKLAPLKTPCYLQYKKSTITSKLHTEIINTLKKNFKLHISPTHNKK